MLNIVIPMAGHGSRFREAGFALPKPLIPVLGTPMIEVVVNNLRPHCPHWFIFLVLAEHRSAFGLDTFLSECAPGCAIVSVETVTEGAACTALLAASFIDNANQLMIAKSDQWVDVDINEYLQVMDDTDADGLIMTMWSDHPKWSYIRLSDESVPTEVVEKQVVSNEATVGIYNYRHGADFVAAAERMIDKNLRVNNEFYVAPAYNEMIENGKRIVFFNVGEEYNGMYGLGIPSDLERFTALPVSQRAVSGGSRSLVSA